jgi:LysR family transcriptional regulator, nitrogen assimilation regulatory protein
MKNVKIQHLRFFVAVYEEHSITAAANRVNATQSGVSMQIRDLEATLGLKLFERASTGVSPTKAGDRIYWRATRILLEVDQLQKDVETHSGELYGSVRAGIMPTFARSVLAPALMRFSDQNPFVEVRIVEGYSMALTEMVANGELDFAVVPGGDLPAGVRSSHVETDIEVLIRRLGKGQASAVQFSLATAPPLKIMLPGPGNARRARIDQYLSNFCTSAHSVMELDSMMTTLDMLDRGEWCSVLPGCLCLSKLDDPKMSLSPILDPLLTVDYLLIEPATKAPPKVAQIFADELCDEIRRSCQQCRDHFFR